MFKNLKCYEIQWDKYFISSNKIFIIPLSHLNLYLMPPEHNYDLF